MKDRNSAAAESQLKDALRQLIDAMQATLSNCLAILRGQSKDLNIRNDPRAHDLYARYDALDALAVFYELVQETCLAEAKAGFRISPPSNRSLAIPNQNDCMELEVIEPDEVELTQVAAPLVAALARRFHKPALHLELRLEYLDHRLSEKINTKGGSPASFMHAFQLGIDRLTIKVQGRLILCELFQHHLGAHLDPFYYQANRLLSDCGILDNEKWIENALYIRELATQAGAVRGSSINDPARGPSESLSPQARAFLLSKRSDTVPTTVPSLQHDFKIESLPSDIDSSIDHFFYLLMAPNSPGTGSMLSPYQRAQIVGALSWVQRESAWSEITFDNERIKLETTRRLYASGVFNASDLVAKEAPAIDFVEQIFLAVSKDELLPEEAKSLICKLHVPTIKLALLDFKFFKNPHHPARETLNRLTELAVGIKNERDKMLSRLAGIVKRIVKRFDTEISVFQETLVELESIALSGSKREDLSERVRETGTQPAFHPSLQQPMTTRFNGGKVIADGGVGGANLIPEESIPVSSEKRPRKQLALKDLPACIKPGVWFEVHQSQSGKKRYLKLQAIMEETKQVVFSNRVGEPELRIDIETFLGDLSRGYSRAIEDNNRFDRALYTVIESIRKSQQQRLQAIR